LRKQSSQLFDEINSLLNKQNALNESVAKVSRMNTEVTQNYSKIGQIEKHIQLSKNKLTKQKRKDTTEAEKAVHELYVSLNEFTKKEKAASKMLSYCMYSANLLTDSGIKAKVIKQYLPVINKFVNQYLFVLDFFVSFNIDENFNESIRSRHRDDFSYESFSEGEKSRIDIALLLTWRQIAKMKNSVSCNLLMLDEIYDGSLDDEGANNLQKILSELDDNIFVISHKKEITESEMFDRVIEFKKDGNFSSIVIK
jgi:DNA repair exonuclease SbcCD ATPase subunit